MMNRTFAAGLIGLMIGLWLGSAMAGVDGRQLVVSVQVTGPGDIEKEALPQAARLGADAVLFVLDGAPGEAIAALSKQAKAKGLKLWIGVRHPGQAPPLASVDVEGLALIFATPKGEPKKPEDLDALLQMKKSGDELGDSIRRIKREIGAGRRLAICVAASEISPETARNVFVAVADLVRDGTLDAVCLSGADGFNFHRLRLLRDAPLHAGIFLDGQSVAEKARGGVVSRAALAAIENDTCESLWLDRVPLDLVGQAVTETVKGYKRNQAQREAIDKAIADGELVIDQEVSEKKCNDQATVHGVGQSFVPAQDGLCPLIQVYAAIRGCKGALPPPLKVEIRIDDRNKPGGAAFGKAEIPAAEFGHEPAYRWVNAYFDPAVRMRKGERFWIYLPNASYPEGSYVWRIVKEGATERGNAWSCRYDYTKGSWVFRVYIKKK